MSRLMISVLFCTIAGCNARPTTGDRMAALDHPLIFQQTIFIASPAEEVWAALVTPASVKQYHLCPLRVLELHPDGRIVYGTDDQVFITGTVVEVIPEQKLTHTFQFNDKTHQNVSGDAESRVTYTIVAMGAMCQLTLTHDQFGSDNQTYANTKEGWPSILSGLKTLVETGKPLPWPTGDAR